MQQQLGMDSPSGTVGSLPSTPSSTTVVNEQEEQLSADVDDAMESDLDAGTPINAKIREALRVHNTLYGASEELSVEGDDVTCTACRTTMKWKERIGFSAIAAHFKTSGHKNKLKVEYDPSRPHTKNDLSSVLLTTGYDSLSKAWTVLPEGKDGILQMQCCQSTGCKATVKGRTVHAILRFAKQHVCKVKAGAQRALKRKTSTGGPHTPGTVRDESGIFLKPDTRIHSLTDAGLKALAPLQSDRRYRRWTWTIATIYQTEKKPAVASGERVSGVH